jgi:hypothetical protein
VSVVVERLKKREFCDLDNSEKEKPRNIFVPHKRTTEIDFPMKVSSLVYIFWD